MYATLIACGSKTCHVAYHTATQGDYGGIAIESIAQQCVIYLV